MQVSVESLGNLERRMTFSLPAERLETQVGGRLREIARDRHASRASAPARCRPR